MSVGFIGWVSLKYPFSDLVHWHLDIAIFLSLFSLACTRCVHFTLSKNGIPCSSVHSNDCLSFSELRRVFPRSKCAVWPCPSEVTLQCRMYPLFISANSVEQFCYTSAMIKKKKKKEKKRNSVSVAGVKKKRKKVFLFMDFHPTAMRWLFEGIRTGVSSWRSWAICAFLISFSGPIYRVFNHFVANLYM